MSRGCIFCKIAAGEIPADVVKRADGMLAFKDMNPQAQKQEFSPTCASTVTTKSPVSVRSAR